MGKADRYVPMRLSGSPAGDSTPGPVRTRLIQISVTSPKEITRQQKPLQRKEGAPGSATDSTKAPVIKTSGTLATETAGQPRHLHIDEEGEGGEEIKKQKKCIPEEETNEDIYCKALAKTLHHIALPVTVGFYAPWGQNKKWLSDGIQDHMSQKGKPNKDGKEGASNMQSAFWLFWHIMFYLPVSSSIKPPKVRYLFLHFDAWEYVGCDHTWAGLVATLLDEIEGKNIVPFSVFRAFGGEFKEEPGKCGKQWVLKPWSRSFFVCGSFLFVVFTLCMVLLRETAEGHVWRNMGYVVLLVVVTFSFPFLCALKNVCFTLKRKLQREMKRKDRSAQLGFMHSVKQEVETMIRFLQFMALIEEKEIRVVLKITNLDLCAPDKVVAVLDAMRLLLCTKKAPFISLLAADPHILVECIQWSNNTCNNGYLYLDRIVSLSFSLPQMSCKAKRQLLKENLNRGGRKKQEEDSVIDPEAQKKDSKSSKKAKSSLTAEEMQHVLRYLSNESVNQYIPGNSIQMKRAVNAVLTILTMVRLGFKPKLKLQTEGKEDQLTIEEVIDWVILAHCWPCRLSWILQCEEDERQQRNLEESQAGSPQQKQANGQSREGKPQEEEGEKGGQRLLAFFEENALELDEMKYKVKRLLELDGDPELFRNFLQKSHFTVERARWSKEALNLLAILPHSTPDFPLFPHQTLRWNFCINYWTMRHC
ncbi:NTPase KAP family P-loop domain-containing protein 1-like isoform X2 [Hemicordylus capensis]|uniref:NTPase KAP family P-loop domain-containing protein 1-like isoform X2 n=1 Tax=Hemicordylus capensis TaxID=884348 RepID=UPI0023026A99|nr:NTPase KAP family P-loop domain-containing protein 1-like isoform X2 [Hemicordylus capensis]